MALNIAQWEEAGSKEERIKNALGSGEGKIEDAG